MAVKVIFFGRLKEVAGSAELVLNGVTDTDQATHILTGRYPGMAGLPYLIAVDKQLIQSNTLLQEGQEVAFLPPYSGG